ncbi:MAG: TonB-dependent receptor plug domain-containing protein [Alistipes sp.]|nr:TonB-dependent receptor plug domain-containing protein [Alistipes sp.]
MRRLLLLVALLCGITKLMAEEPFNGIVTHPDGRGIKARISVVGRDKQTMADGNGRFGLTNIEANDTLLFIFKRDTLRVAVEGRRSVNVVWTVGSDFYTAKEDEDLVNFGFGYVKRRESTDYTSGISGERLRATGCMSVVDAIMMCYPGLKRINGELCLRTQNSINGSSGVLILCDNAEVNPDSININDVKSVEILKGSNMYGFRGVNGVVLITTVTAEDVLKRER